MYNVHAQSTQWVMRRLQNIACAAHMHIYCYAIGKIVFWPILIKKNKCSMLRNENAG